MVTQSGGRRGGSRTLGSGTAVNCMHPHQCPTASCLQLSPSPHHPVSQTPRNLVILSGSPSHTSFQPIPWSPPPLLQPLMFPLPSTPPFSLAPVLSPLPLPASLPASLSARLQLGDNLPHLASRLLPRLIAQLVPGAQPSFFPTPTPSPAPSYPIPSLLPPLTPWGPAAPCSEHLSQVWLARTGAGCEQKGRDSNWECGCWALGDPGVGVAAGSGREALAGVLCPPVVPIPQNCSSPILRPPRMEPPGFLTTKENGGWTER